MKTNPEAVQYSLYISDEHFTKHVVVLLADNGDGTESFRDAGDDENARQST